MKSETNVNPPGRESDVCPYIPLYVTDVENSGLYLYDVNTKSVLLFLLNRPHFEKYASTIIVSSTFYIIGGDDPESSAVYSVSLRGISPPSLEGLKLSSRIHLKFPRGDAGLAQMMGRYIFAAGGSVGGSRPSKQCERYDTVGDTWETLPTLREAKSSVAVCEFSGWLYAVGGHTGGRLGDGVWVQTVERLDTRDETEGWAKLVLMQHADESKKWDVRNCCGICGISDQQILIFGGYNGRSMLNGTFVMSATVEVHEGKTATKIEAYGELQEQDNFVYNYSYIWGNGSKEGRLHAMSYCGQRLHIFDAKTRRWSAAERPWGTL